VQVALDRGQRDVHDRVVEHDHEQREAHRAERPPAAVLLGDQAPTLGQHPLSHVYSFLRLDKRSQSWWRETLLNSHP
jgi:hypothetical protein